MIFTRIMSSLWYVMQLLPFVNLLQKPHFGVYTFRFSNKLLQCKSIQLSLDCNICRLSNEINRCINYYYYWLLYLFLYEESTSANPTQAEKEEVDSRSIYVGNVRLFLSWCLHHSYCWSYNKLFMLFRIILVGFRTMFHVC